MWNKIQLTSYNNKNEVVILLKINTSLTIKFSYSFNVFKTQWYIHKSLYFIIIREIIWWLFYLSSEFKQTPFEMRFIAYPRLPWYKSGVRRKEEKETYTHKKPLSTDTGSDRTKYINITHIEEKCFKIRPPLWT